MTYSLSIYSNFDINDVNLFVKKALFNFDFMRKVCPRIFDYGVIAINP